MRHETWTSLQWALLLAGLGVGLCQRPLRLEVALWPAWMQQDRLPIEFVVKKAFQHLRQDGFLPPQVRIELMVRPGCLSGTVTKDLAELRIFGNVSAVLGVPCSSGTEGAGLLAAEWDIPVVSSSSMAPVMAQKSRYATLARVSETTTAVGVSLLEFLQHMDWLQVGVVGDPQYSRYILDSIRSAIQPPWAHVNVEEHLNSNNMSLRSMDRALERLRRASRVIIVALDRIAGGAEAGLNATAAFLARAHHHNMTSPDFVYIVPLGQGAFIGARQLDTRVGRLTVLDGQYENLDPTILRHTFVHQRTGRSLETIMPFLQRFENWTMEPGADQLVPNINAIYQRKDWSLLLTMQNYDMAYVYGLAVGKCYRDPQCDPLSGRQIMDKIRLSEFSGTTGRVIMTGDFDREVGYRIYALDPQTKLQTQYFAQELYLANRTVAGPNGTNETEQYPARRFEVLKDFPWATRNAKPPPAKPRCGFLGDGCPESLWPELGIGLGVGAAVLLLLVLAVFKYRQQMLENEILSKSWEIRFEELRMMGRDGNSSMREMSSLRTMGSTAHSETSRMAKFDDADGLIGYIGQAKLANRSVAVKQYPATGELAFKKRSELVQLKQLKDLNHDNLTGFLGLCLGRKDRLLVVWEACRKGSLADILANEEIQLDATFRGSIIRDVVMGLDFLHHSAVGVHGELSAENCVVDSRWTVKLTDFGVGDVLRAQRLRGAVSLKAFTAEKLLHVAPEALRFWSQEFGVSAAPTPEADVYALGMVLYQVLTRRPLYDEERLSSKELISNLTGGKMDDYRPPVPTKLDDDPQGEASAILLPMMLKCWSGDPVARPKMGRIRKVVGSLSASGRNLVEHMMSVMEKYAGNLEKMVATRTTQVQEERRRAEDLLARMLPASVAEELKAGQPVPPETFHSTTIYFSDIVGFTAISGRSEPLQVVQLLNYLYSTFDNIIAKYDAYKVETIGDAYMVVSGLPRRNGEAHAVEIGRMALEIRDAVGEMRVPHFPSEHLRVRIGLHSGPCAAGVVGNTMPRYCLFGDTVNTASRMESTGEPMKVQVSGGTQALLAKVAPEAFSLAFRATITVKGKGEVSTYWLHHPHTNYQEAE